MFHRLPLSGLLDGVAMALEFIFLVTSVDSATFVLGMLTSGGCLDPPRSRRLAWGAGIGLLAAPLLLVGEVEVFKAVLVSGVLPYSLVMLLQVASLIRALRTDAPRGASRRAA